MPKILDQISQSEDTFRPSTPNEYFALQLARKLDDLKQLRSYVTLLEHHSQDRILRIFKKIGASEGRGERFCLELAALLNQE